MQSFGVFPSVPPAQTQTLNLGCQRFSADADNHPGAQLVPQPAQPRVPILPIRQRPDIIRFGDQIPRQTPHSLRAAQRCTAEFTVRLRAGQAARPRLAKQPRHRRSQIVVVSQRRAKSIRTPATQAA
jgi:hypothetical protein